jgi:hypothetical protein
VVPGRHVGEAALLVTADTKAWLSLQNRDLTLADAIAAELVSYSDETLFAAYMRCFPL